MADFYLLVLGLLVFVSSLISVRLGLSVSIIEILFGVIAGNLGIIHSETWMLFIASFGGILLTFLSGTEIDVKLMRKKT
ncbi:cation:proton antiporter domain-containing protein [Methanobrevibacter arboriphilus]|uniref:cation:proton antiporter domain-containing protein n=1 Tax=Methanobrevibacter arboriphilus TaxID=39441 RepID=UPI000AD1F9BA|nr:cation:proton antiporter [Methanobrevibacter arboriphilus]